MIKKISILGLGLLGASVALSVRRAMAGVKIVGFSHRQSTRQKALQQGIVDEVFDTASQAVADADLVILATPILTFKDYLAQINPVLKSGAIITDVGSTKQFVHQWARKYLKNPRVFFVGSHPIAGSEKQGLDYARDDLFIGARCILTYDATSSKTALRKVKRFWQQIGCSVQMMRPAEHDRILGMVSHLPHISAASLVNTNPLKDLYNAGKGFMDCSRVASGPENIWVDIFLTNRKAVLRGIDKFIAQLKLFQKAIAKKDAKRLEKLLAQARQKRQQLIDFKIKRNELF